MSVTRDSIVVGAALLVVVSSISLAATAGIGARESVDEPAPVPDSGATSNASVDAAAGGEPDREADVDARSRSDGVGVAATDDVGDPGFGTTGGTVRPGENVTVAVTYTSDGTRADEVSVQLGFDAPLDRDGWEIVAFGAPDGGEWFESDRYFRAVEVGPNETVTATITVRPPPDASPGNYTIGATASATDGKSGIKENLDVPVTVESACEGGAETVPRIAFAYGDYGGNLNLEVNGDFRNVDRFGALNGTTVGGATVRVNRTSSNRGTVTIDGDVSGFCVGGQELWIDDVAFGSATNPRSVVGFDRLRPARSGYGVGDSFRALPSNVTVRVAAFRFADGTRYTGGTAAPSNRSSPLSGGSGQDLNARNVNLAFEIGSVPADESRPFELNLAERPTGEGARRLAELVQEGELTEGDAAGRLEELDSEKAGAILEYLLFHGEPIIAADLLDEMGEGTASEALAGSPELRRTYTDPRFQQMRDGMNQHELARLVVESEEGEFFTPNGSDVRLRNVSEISDIELRHRDLPSLNRSRTLNARTLSTGSPRWYDSRVRWKKPGPTGFGMYMGLDIARDSGDILSFAGGGRSGGLWRKESWNHTDAWDRVGNSLEAPYDIVDAAIDPNDADHLYAIVPETKETFALVESTDGGLTWRENGNFSRKFVLKDDKGGTSEFGRGARVEVFDNGRVFLYNYEDTGASGIPGNFSAHFQGREGVTRPVDLSARSGVTITYYERAASFDGGRENPKLQFHDGTRWRTLRTAGPNSFDWRKRTATVPDRWLGPDSRIRFKFGNGEPGDHWFVDNVTVSSNAGTVFEEGWEDGTLRDWSSIRLPTVADEDNWVYHSTDGGSTWQAGSINVPNPERPGTKTGNHYARNRISFSNAGHGVMNPTGKVLYVTRDYGRSWQQLKNYSGTNALTHAVADDGTVHVAHNINNDTYLETYDASGTRTDNRTLSGPSKSFRRRNGRPGLCQFCPQVMTVDADDSSHIVLFTYSSGPYQSLDGGDSWNKLFSLNKVIVHGPEVDPKKLRTGTVTNPNRGPKRTMVKPTDYRDATMMEEVGKGDAVLIGSDQGLFMMRVDDRTVGKRVRLHNLAGSMDHTEVYDVNVDDCGNIYHGLWHSSGMVRTARAHGNVEQRWRTRRQYQRQGLYRQLLHLDYQPYYTGGAEAGNVFVKDRSDCLSWASLGDSVAEGGLNFSPYITNESGPLRKEKIAGLDVKNATGGPKFFDGRWHYREKNSSRLVSVDLSSGSQTVELRNIAGTRLDESPPGNVDETLWIKRRGTDPRSERLQRYEGTSQSSALTTAVDFRGSQYVIEHFDVAEGRVALNVKRNRTAREDVYIYDTASASEPITEADVTPLRNPFGGMKIHEVFVDPTNDSRYFATVTERNDPKCTAHLMVTEDGGATWEKFSEEVDCHRVWDLAFDENNEKIYASTHGRGVLRGNLTDLNDPGTDRGANLAVDVRCGDREVMETAVVNCTVTVSSSGDVSEWRNRVDGPDVEIDLPYRTVRYSLPAPVVRRGPTIWCSPKNPTLAGVQQYKRIHCEDPLRNFPASGRVTFGMDLQKRLVDDDPARPEITARLNFSQGPPDFDVSDNSDTTTLEVHGLPAQADRFDYHRDAFGDVIRNDDRSNATRILARDWNQTPDQFFACPDDPDYPNGDAIVRRLQSQGKNCEGVLDNGSQGAPLSGIQIYTANLSELGIGFTEDFYNVTIIGEEVPPPTVGEVPPKEPTCGTFEQEFTRQASSPTRTYLFTLSSSYRQYFAGEPSGQEDVQPRYKDKDVPPPVNRSFAQNGIYLSSKAFIGLPNGSADWDTGPWEVRNTFLVVEQPDGSLKVYRLNPAGTITRFNRTIESHSRITINVTGTTITVADDDVPPGTQLIPLNATKLRPNVTTSAGATRNGDVTIERYPGLNRLSATVECPRDKGLGHLILALGQSFRTGGGYELSMEYRVTYERGAARHATVGVGVGQYDEFGVDITEGEWTDRPVDPEELEEIERAIAVGEIGLNPDPAPDGPPSRVRVSVSTLDGPTGGAPAFGRALGTDGGHPYVRVEPLDRFEGRGRLTFTVRDETLERNGVGADRVALFRYENTENGWQRQQTERVGSTDAGVRFRSEFDGLSLFAVGITAPGGDGNVTLSLVPAERTVQSGTNATFEVVADGIDAGVGSYELVVNSTDTSRGRIVEVSSGIGGESRRELTADGSGATVAAFAGDTADTGSVTLTTVTVVTGEPGTVDLPLTVDSVSDEVGDQYAIGGVTGATVTVTEEPVAPDVTGDGNPATDPDGDGLYEDLNGDGQAAPGDATVLFNAVFEGEAAVTDNVRLFDFSGDGQVTPGDATVLFDEVF